MLLRCHQELILALDVALACARCKGSASHAAGDVDAPATLAGTTEGAAAAECPGSRSTGAAGSAQGADEPDDSFSLPRSSLRRPARGWVAALMSSPRSMVARKVWICLGSFPVSGNPFARTKTPSRGIQHATQSIIETFCNDANTAGLLVAREETEVIESTSSSRRSSTLFIASCLILDPDDSPRQRDIHFSSHSWVPTLQARRLSLARRLSGVLRQDL